MEYYRDALKNRAAKYGPPPYKCHSLNGKWAYGHKIATSNSTSKTPVACTFQNKLYLFWKANDSGNRIYNSSSSDGISWPAAHRINDFDKTPQAPKACVFNHQFYLFWKSKDSGNRIYCSINYRRHHSEEIKFEYECLIDEIEE